MLKEAGPKLPVPLKAPLGEMDKTAVGPYRFVGQIPMSSSVQEVLGTDEFIDFKFVDTRIEKESNPLRHVRLSVPYYTGGARPGATHAGPVHDRCGLCAKDR
jgi:hypothetical protein